MNLGLTSVAAGRSAILSYTTPLWVVPGAMLILGERLHLVKAMALLLGLAGVAFMFNPLGFNWSDHKAIVGNGYLLAAAVLWAGTTIHVRAHRWRGTPLALAPWQMLAGFVPMLVLSRWVEGPAPHIGFSWSVVLLALYTGPVITAFPFWAFVTIARTLPALTTSLTLLLVPVVGLLSSAAALSEPLDVTTVVGLLLIVSAVAAVKPGRCSAGSLRAERAAWQFAIAKADGDESAAAPCGRRHRPAGRLCKPRVSPGRSRRPSRRRLPRSARHSDRRCSACVLFVIDIGARDLREVGVRFQ